MAFYPPLPFEERHKVTTAKKDHPCHICILDSLEENWQVKKGELLVRGDGLKYHISCFNKFFENQGYVVDTKEKAVKTI